MIRLIILILTLSLLLTQNSTAQNDKKIAEQKAKVERLERQIAQREKELSSLKKNRASIEREARALARQIEDRNELIEQSREEEQLIVEQVELLKENSTQLHVQLLSTKSEYAEMVRDAWRNYKQRNYIAYLFAAQSFKDMANRISILRHAAELRRLRINKIDSLERENLLQQEALDRSHKQLDSVRKSLTEQRRELQQDANNAKKRISQLSTKEREALREKVESQEQLEVAIAELRKLSKGNKTGASFNNKTQNLNLPVEGGKVKRYRQNMAEITGEKGAKVVSIYEGKVVDIKRNKITNKFDIYIAHGEYITSYANLSDTAVEKGVTVKRNQQIGTIGSSVDVATMESEYKIVFGIYAPTPDQKMLAADCFKKS